ncbi:hypothetical protein PGT21_033242 [Puccinia graminis f. sp. tritici]|uniref:Uncharacterized protein n=1 Tax=Puccinia graminis f. sp. tritici TaxID=56615 RepID=A0A5B0RW81_PUCGR|nr:hypothetical protein PGT21_033242 [Puccinia graminis f. sp. tritici]KAA1130241.1 hypothetical protein PGTUg99_016697 [Puccinia graminis f. sp. tritici]
MGLASSIYKARCNCQCSLLCDPHAVRAPRRGQKLCVKWLKPSPVDKFRVELASEHKTPPDCEDTKSINLRLLYGQAMHYSLRLSSRFQPDESVNNGFYASVMHGKPVIDYVCDSRLEVRSPSLRGNN